MVLATKLLTKNEIQQCVNLHISMEINVELNQFSKSLLLCFNTNRKEGVSEDGDTLKMKKKIEQKLIIR